MIKDKTAIEKAAEKINPEKDFFDVSGIWGKWPAAIILKRVYPTQITPSQLTIAALIFGISAAYFLAQEGYLFLLIGALFVQLKNIFDTVDGNLARAKNASSRVGRFLDSITDFITNFSLFIAIGWHLEKQYSASGIWILTAIAFLSSELQCSYYVFYIVSYLKISNRITVNRVDESIQEEDLATNGGKDSKKVAIFLQRVFLILYGWQDRFIIKIDKWGLKYFDKCPSGWYLNRNLLTMTCWLGLGMQLFFITLFSILNQLYFYLWFTVLCGNIYWIFLAFYRVRYFKNMGMKNNL